MTNLTSHKLYNLDSIRATSAYLPANQPQP